MMVLLASARLDSSVESCEIQFSRIGWKSIQGIPRPATVKVSIGLRRLVDTAQ